MDTVARRVKGFEELTSVSARGEAARHGEEIPAYRTTQRLIQLLLLDFRPSLRLVIVEIAVLEHRCTSVMSYSVGGGKVG